MSVGAPLICVLILLLFAQEARAAGDDLADSLIQDALTYYTLKVRPEKLARQLKQVENEKPKMESKYKDLRMGEFELEQEFAKRQQLARATEEMTFREKLETWHRTREEIISQLEDAKKEVGSFKPKLCIVRSSDVGIPIQRFQWKPGPMQLPYFDRKSKSFDNVNLEIGTHIIKFKQNDDILGELIFRSWDKANITIADLKIAARFKEDLGQGRVTFRVDVKPVLAGCCTFPEVGYLVSGSGPR